MEKEGLIYRYVGQVKELHDGKNGEVVLKDGKVHVFYQGWKEVEPVSAQDFESRVRDAVYNAEDCKLKTKLLQIFKEYDDFKLLLANI